ncbi:MAG: thiamine pyrophosphate-dependent enzyme [Jatrophihabitans sp.]
MTTPHDELDAAVRAELAALPGAEPAARHATETAFAAFDAMAGSRHLDIEARRMRERGEGFYTIGSAGHESNALVAAALRATDPALLHYRSGAFYLARSLQAGRSLADGLRDVLYGLAAATADPASGGRHKVFGNPALAVIPQTSTIASHLPRAVGVAFALGRAKRLGVPTHWPTDAIAVTSLGDASLNHSTAVGALNTVGYSSHRGLPMPLLIVCEDNGWGISVPSPDGWVQRAAQRPELRYLAAAGDHPAELRAAAAEAVRYVRTSRRPALLHLRTVRYLGHAGTDVETAYRSVADLAADRARDPLLAEARSLVRAGTTSGVALVDRYDAIARRVHQLAGEVATLPKLVSRAEVMAPLHPTGETSQPVGDRTTAFDGKLPEDGGELTLAQSINAALTDELAARPEVLVFGEDTGRKGGVYGVTRGLATRFGTPRVFDTLLDEQAILGLALGSGLSGLLPVPEIQYLAYLHNALDQIRGEAASLRFFSNDTFRNPMVVRVAGLAYQKGFGGHFHNDNAVAALRDIPGLVVCVPANPADAAPLLRTCIAAAADTGTVSVYLEPIALYHERDLLEPGDRGWLAAYPAPGTVDAPIGSVRGYGVEAADSELTMLTFGNGLRMSLRVAAQLATEGTRIRVVDLRWISPLPAAAIAAECGRVPRMLVVDETRRSGGVGEGVVSALVECGYPGRIGRVASADSYIPLADAANLVLLGQAEIEAAARSMLGERAR